MAFWGVEVKPNKPFKLSYDDFEGPRLHLTQATLGKTPANERVILKCKVEGSPSVFLCSLLPGVLETCSLNVYFSNDAVFTVEGSGSVHLAGYCDVDRDECSEDEDYYDDESDHDYDDYDEEEEEEADDDSMIYSGDSEASDEEDLSDGDEPVMVPNRGVTIEELTEDEPPKVESKRLRSAVVKHEKGNAQLKFLDKAAKLAKTNEIKIGKCTAREKLVTKDGKRLLEKEMPSKILPADASTSEDEDGFPLTSKRKHEEVDYNEPCKKKHNQLLSQFEAEASPMLKEEGDLKEEVFSTPLMKAKKDKKKKKKKAADLQEHLETTATNHGDAPIETPVSGDNNNGTEVGEGEQTSNKKKKKKNRKKKKDILSDEQEAPSENHRKEVPSTQIANGVSGKSDDEGAKTPNKKGTMRKYPNGLEVENILMGKPDGKQAKPGKKVGMIYIGKLKSNGKVFDSNVGRKPFVFRLGVGEVIKGWDVGVSGMRVGDKRRLTIPPVMGYGHTAIPGIPPNSWLLFDVELTDVK